MAWKYVNLINRWGFSNKDLKMQVALYEHNMVYVWLRFKRWDFWYWYYFDATKIDGNETVYNLLKRLNKNKCGRRWLLRIMKENVKGNIFNQRDTFHKMSLIWKQTGKKVWDNAAQTYVSKGDFSDWLTNYNLNEGKWKPWDTLLEFWPEINPIYHPYADKMDFVFLQISNKKKFDYCSYEYFPKFEDVPENIAGTTDFYRSSISNQPEEKLLACIKRLSPSKYALVSEQVNELLQEQTLVCIEINCYFSDNALRIYPQIWYYDKSEQKPKRKWNLEY